MRVSSFVQNQDHSQLRQNDFYLEILEEGRPSTLGRRYSTKSSSSLVQLSSHSLRGHEKVKRVHNDDTL